MPGYLELCVNTWRHYLPEYEIAILDYESITDWLPHDMVKRFSCKSAPLPMQADIYRALLIQRYGGIWFDCDTIITAAAANTIRNLTGETAFIGSAEARWVHAAFIYAKHPHAHIIDEWVNELRNRVPFLRLKHSSKLGRIIFKLMTYLKLTKHINWDYVFNSIVNTLVMNTDNGTAQVLDRWIFGVFPEDTLPENSPNVRYEDFWFTAGEVDNIKQYVKSGIILLHNSWTPKQFKEMSSEEFLRQDIRLSRLLRTVI